MKTQRGVDALLSRILATAASTGEAPLRMERGTKDELGVRTLSVTRGATVY